MQKSNYSISAFALIVSAVFFLSSCSSVSVTQRKYNKGFHFEWASSQKVNSKVNKTKTEKNPNRTEVSENPSVVLSNEVENNNIEQNFDFENNNKTVATKNSTVKTKKSLFISDKNAVNTNSISIKSFSKTTFIKAIKSQKSSADSDLLYVLLIILALFIPPLAVFLHDGGWTGNVTLSLILTILFGALGFGGFVSIGGLNALLWLIPVIHALLIVI